jgi:endoribonuclease LACTB2
MLEIETLDDVTRVVMSTAITRSAGYTASAFLTRGVMIDLGFPAIWGELEKWIAATRPAGSILTHHHEDHAGNAELAARRALPLAAAPLTFALLRESTPIELHRRILWGTPHRLTTPITPLVPGGLRLIATPGHTPDHHVVWDAERGTLFAGDLFLGVKVRALHRHEDPRRTARSVRAVAALAPERMFDSHRGLVTNPVALLLAKSDWIDTTIAAIERRLAAGWSDRAITRDVLGREDAVYYLSNGALAKINFVRAVRHASPYV